MKRFHLFHGWIYYPSKGLGDYKGSFVTREEADAAIPEADPYMWVRIIESKEDGSLATVLGIHSLYDYPETSWEVDDFSND
jgi:hypothetical protein